MQYPVHKHNFQIIIRLTSYQWIIVTDLEN